VRLTVLQGLLRLEAPGARFEVKPPSSRRIKTKRGVSVEYQADDSHLFSDVTARPTMPIKRPQGPGHRASFDIRSNLGVGEFLVVTATTVWR
jgi:hypothetical protein